MNSSKEITKPYRNQRRLLVLLCLPFIASAYAATPATALKRVPIIFRGEEGPVFASIKSEKRGTAAAVQPRRYKTEKEKQSCNGMYIGMGVPSQGLEEEEEVPLTLFLFGSTEKKMEAQVGKRVRYLTKQNIIAF